MIGHQYVKVPTFGNYTTYLQIWNCNKWYEIIFHPRHLQFSKSMRNISAIIKFQFEAITLVRFFEVWRSSYQWNATAELWFLQSSSIQQFYIWTTMISTAGLTSQKKPPV